MECHGISTGVLCTEGHPILLLRLRGRTGTSFSILGRYVTTLFKGCILVFQDMLNAKFQPLQSRLRTRTMSEGTGQGLLGPGDRGDPPPTGWQDVNPNPVHTRTCGVTQKIKKPSPFPHTPGGRRPEASPAARARLPPPFPGPLAPPPQLAEPVRARHAARAAGSRPPRLPGAAFVRRRLAARPARRARHFVLGGWAPAGQAPGGPRAGEGLPTPVQRRPHVCAQ